MTAEARTQQFRTACPSCGAVFRLSDRHRGRTVGCRRCGGRWRAGSENPSSPGVGRTLGQYVLVRMLGRGPAGEVYEALDRVLDRRVAIKLLPNHLAGDPAVMQRLILEAREAARVQHPNVLRIQHVGADGGAFFVVAEFVEGGSAADYLSARGAMSPVEAGRVVADAARGLAAAHALGIVHRNLKPSNILCGVEGVVKVADFGLPKRPSARRPGVPGSDSHLYSSPEHFRGELLDPRSDVYSLGAVWFHLLTGRPPFPARTPEEAARFHQTAPVPDPRQLREAVPERSAALVRKCLAKEPEGRFASMEELLGELEAAGLTVTPTDPAGDGQSVRWIAFLAAQIGRDAESLDLLPELAPAGSSDGEEQSEDLLPAFGRPPAEPEPPSAQLDESSIGPPLGKPPASWARSTSATEREPAEEPSAISVPLLLAASGLLGLSLAVVLRLSASSPGTDPPEPAPQPKPETRRPGRTEEFPAEFPPVAHDDPLAAEYDREMPVLTELADRRDWTLTELDAVIRRFEAFHARMRGTRFDYGIVSRLERLREIRAELAARPPAKGDPRPRRDKGSD